MVSLIVIDDGGLIQIGAFERRANLLSDNEQVISERIPITYFYFQAEKSCSGRDDILPHVLVVHVLTQEQRNACYQCRQLYQDSANNVSELFSIHGHSVDDVVGYSQSPAPMSG